jgi:hypothetical protein
MAERADVAKLDLAWDPPKYAVWSRRWDSNNAATLILLSHPAAPFPATPALVGAIDDATMQELALAYLKLANENKFIDPPLELPKSWLDALSL